MHVGMLTAPFGDTPLEGVLDFAEEAQILSLEVASGPGSKHIDPTKLTAAQVKKIRALLDERGLNISALAAYNAGFTDPKNTRAAAALAKKTIDAAAMLGVDVVCMLGGYPAPGLSKVETIRTVLPGYYKPLLAHARKKKVKIALENWFATCLQGIDTFECMFQTIPDENFGLNYDPSHLVHQECDYMLPVAMFPERLFHTHAKDTLINAAQRARLGVYARGWWRYVIPGFGCIKWGEYITNLRIAGYDGVLSIEHEDGTQTREEGFMRGAMYLDQFC
jgi:sugar phosphate isomerase/epimerase